MHVTNVLFSRNESQFSLAIQCYSMISVFGVNNDTKCKNKDIDSQEYCRRNESTIRNELNG